MRIWSPITSAASRPSGPSHFRFIKAPHSCLGRSAISAFAVVASNPVPSLIRVAFDERVRTDGRKGAQVASSSNTRIQARNDLAWAISVGGIGVVLFAALLVATWYFASTLFLIF